MAAFLFLLALLGGALLGDLAWENTGAGQVTVLDRTVTGYPQGWLLAAAAGLGLVVGLLLVASASSTKGRRARRRQLRSMKRDVEHEGIGPDGDHAIWLDESFGRRGTAADAGEPVPRQSEPLYEQARRAARLHEEHRHQ